MIAKIIPNMYIKYCVPWVYISAGVPRIKMADMKETKMDMATGTSCRLRPPIRNSDVVFWRPPIQPIQA